VVAHRVGEPFGTLVLAVAVTVIEVALIVSVMIGGGEDKSGLARDTVFAAVMLICNGLVGLCLVVGGVRHYEQGFQALGASAALAVLAALVTGHGRLAGLWYGRVCPDPISRGSSASAISPRTSLY
jgi:Ca2+:H+ antiporter